ncbi:MAG: ATP-binding protein, partial [Actinomycetota bacterium]|nr:ATP-binding protein [Actinomycetota bacterium]
LNPADARVVAAVRAQLRADALHRLLGEYVLALVLMTLVSVAAGYLLAGRVLAPLREITAAARRVSGENLGERISLAGPADELRELADTFDGMLGRLQDAFTSQRHFVASASHELRTPLAIMRTEVDVALADEAASSVELREMGEAVRETVDRSEALIESLLMLARSEAGADQQEPVDLAGLAADCVTDLRARAQERQIVVTAQLEPATVRGQAALLERTIANLIENGIRHNVVGGWLSVATGRDSGWVRLSVSNGGPVIESARAQDLTEPFRRLHNEGEGFGLGLSIVQSVVQTHRGSLQLAAPPSGGLTVKIRLPSTGPYTELTPVALETGSLQLHEVP